MRALDRKLFRDLWHMKGQALAIAMVLASGVATYVMSLSMLHSLQATQAQFYRDLRFADVFASLKRAPENVLGRIEEIPGVQHAETRVMAGATLQVEGYNDPVAAFIVSLPDHGVPALNGLYLKAGRTVDGSREDEVVVSESFADAHGLRPGDVLSATINGRRRKLEIVGTGISPEYVYQVQPGAVIPDFRSFGILWMARTPLARAFDMDGAFNTVALSLSRGAVAEDVIDRMDALLDRYGGLGAYSRKDQTSHRYLSEEFRQLEQMATMFPAIFLSVAAFLLNVVVTRLIATQRDQVAILKAFGYSNLAIVTHYLKLVVLMVCVGVAAGIGFGVWLAQGLSNMYMEFYRFPYMLYELRPQVALTAGLISAGAAMVGTVFSVMRAALLPPAEAMQPPPPAKYRKSLVERTWIGRTLDQPTRMIIRNVERRPLKSALSVLGIGAACAILLVGGFFSDSADHMLNIQFKLAQTYDLSVTFAEPTSRRALYSLASMEGVHRAEPFRSVPVRLKHEHRSYRTGLQGIDPEGILHKLLDVELREIELPPDGIVLTDHLADILGIRPGDLLTVEILEGERPVLQAPVTGVVKEYIGVSAYMQLPALNRLMREGPAISGAHLLADRHYEQQLIDELRDTPRVLGATIRRRVLESFYETMAKQALTFAFFNTLLASTIAFGVVYNSARIALSERSRELASLRVLGFTRGEISYILLGELAALTAIGIPIGFVLGRMLTRQMVEGLQTDLFRIPAVINASTYSFAALVVLASSVISALVVKRYLNRLDLVAVLKTKE